MLLILIVAFIATRQFYKAAKLRGSHPGKAASVPIIAACVLLIADKFASPMLLAVMESVGVSEVTCGIIATGYNFLLVLIYLVYLRKNWRALCLD